MALKKESTRIQKTLTLDKSLLDAMTKKAEENYNTPVSRMIDQAIKEYLENHKGC